MTSARQPPRRTRALAASFVVTSGLIAGCKGTQAPETTSQSPTAFECLPPDCHMNPPPCPGAPGCPKEEPPPTATPSASGAPSAALTVATAAPSAALTVATAAPSASAPRSYYPKCSPDDRVVAEAPGRCSFIPMNYCPPYDPKHPMTCNPPAPMPCVCPDDK